MGPGAGYRAVTGWRPNHPGALSSRERQLRGLRPWQPGQSGNPKGRPKGSRHKLGEDFLAAMVAHFEQHGPATIVKVREERPADYLKIVASILPKELNVRTDPLEELCDDELERGIAILQAMIAAQGEGAVDPALSTNALRR